MKDVMRKDWEWVIDVSYYAGGEAKFYLDSMHHPTVYLAIAKVYLHIQDTQYAEIISIYQKKKEK